MSQEITLFITQPDGTQRTIQANVGDTLMETLKAQGVELEAACGGCCACATCHVYLSDEAFNKIEAASDDEVNMLDMAFDLTETSRLSCQIVLTEDMHEMEVTIPED